ncbi:2-C-methyl-D-erythritol 4-phosphate cytidylyltransferase [uncultured Selenomonas sp.]|uniref:2-C-methyl-D-erythritol 4-phosphate cytidylyltransferase n=1 Tax=uncultured Selenomonas sp. TaxID=159275 RepID=UPI0025D18E14|nr:2-C-methyl-D-erythritol 4-phosphate cytidylyltransferase [uncultured Selenomonas sp.]
MVSVIFPAAGAGRRMKADRNKVLLELSGVPILLRTLRRFSAVPAVAELIVVVAKDEIAFVEGMLEKAQGLKPWRVVQGGAERQYSIANGMAHLAANADVVLVHDAARPLVSLAAIEAVIFAAREKGAAITAVRAKNTIKVVGEDGRVEATPARASLWEVQTPQGFRREILERAYEKAAQDGFLGTDDASLVERIGEAVFVVESDYGNLKITTPEDLWMAESLLAHPAGIADEMKVTI